MIIVSYGIPKTGSTLAFEMARAVLEANEHPQRWLGEKLVDSTPDVNFVREWSDERLDALVQATRGERIVIKTHRGMGKLSVPAVYEAIDAGELRVHVVIRDPRDTIVSMIDNIALMRRMGQPAAGDRSVGGAISRLAGDVPILRWWGAFPALYLHYEEYAFHRGVGPLAIADDLGLRVDPEEVWRRVEDRFTQLNVGRPERYKTDLWPDEVEAIERAFPLFVEVAAGRVPKGWFRSHR